MLYLAHKISTGVFNVLCFILLTFKGYSQDGLSLQTTLYAGKSMFVKEDVRFPKSPITAFSIEVSKQTTGKKYWQFAHNYPQMGILLSYSSLGNKKILGNALSLVPYLEFNVWRWKGGEFQIKHGTGIAYTTKQFDSAHNADNKLISTKLNATSILDIGYKFNIREKSALKLGVFFHHISNGAWKLPNYGINNASFYIRYCSYLHQPPSVYKTYSPIRDFRKIRYKVLGSFNYNTVNVDILGKLRSQLSALVLYQHNTRFRTGAGFEFGNLPRTKPQASIYLEEEIQIGHISTRYGFGRYMQNVLAAPERVYSKIGITYYPCLNNEITERLFWGLMIKSHQFKAAHIEFNVGFLF